MMAVLGSVRADSWRVRYGFVSVVVFVIGFGCRCRVERVYQIGESKGACI